MSTNNERKEFDECSNCGACILPSDTPKLCETCAYEDYMECQALYEDGEWC